MKDTRQVKRILEGIYGRGNVVCRKGRGTACGWIHVYVIVEPGKVLAREEREKVAEIVRKNYEVGRWYNDGLEGEEMIVEVIYRDCRIEMLAEVAERINKGELEGYLETSFGMMRITGVDTREWWIKTGKGFNERSFMSTPASYVWVGGGY